MDNVKRLRQSGQQSLPIRGQDDLSTGTDEQGAAEMLFQGTDLMADRRRRKAQLFACPGKAAKTCSCLEGAQGMQARDTLHKSSP